ncbi:hypothetical protein [Streptomyces sp. NPDC058745]|uniref:hypothetical protein n=1 Tax=Streptomyces sp. NPDC058745 TaxID=3346621 RepID=UPI003675D78C
MAQALIPAAAGLIVDVHEGSADDVRVRLQGLDRHELEGLAVVLAGLADPDRSVPDALGWVNFDEYGDPLPPRKPLANRKVRDLAPDAVKRTRGVDVVAVNRALVPGQSVPLSQAERTLAVEVGIRRGMGYRGVAQQLGMDVEAVMKAWDRAKKRAVAAGRPVPLVPVNQIRDAA